MTDDRVNAFQSGDSSSAESKSVSGGGERRRGTTICNYDTLRIDSALISRRERILEPSFHRGRKLDGATGGGWRPLTAPVGSLFHIHYGSIQFYRPLLKKK